MALLMTTRLLCRRNIPVFAYKNFRSLNAGCSSLSTSPNTEKHQRFRFKNQISGCRCYSDVSEAKKMTPGEWDTTVLELLETLSDEKKFDYLGHRHTDVEVDYDSPYRLSMIKDDIMKMLQTDEVNISEVEEMVKDINWSTIDPTDFLKKSLLVVVFKAYLANNDATKARELWNELMKEKPYDFRRIIHALGLYRLMVKQKRTDEAIDFITEYGNNYFNHIPPETTDEARQLIFRLTMQLMSKNVCLSPKETFRAVLAPVKVANRYFPSRYYLDSFVERGNAEEILEAYAIIAKVYRTSDRKVHKIFKFFIGTGNEEALQKAVQISNTVRDPMFTFLDLMCVFAGTGNYSSADKLYQKMCDDSKWNSVLMKGLSSALDGDDIPMLEKFLEFLKDKNEDNVDGKLKRSMISLKYYTRARKIIIRNNIRQCPDGMVFRCLETMEPGQNPFTELNEPSRD